MPAVPGYSFWLKRTTPLPAQRRATRMLEGNGLVVQSARARGRGCVSLPTELKPQ